jgi:hypothetical protein
MAANLEKRVEALERELKSLKSAIQKKSREPWWERLAGTFEDDPIFDEIVNAGRKYRQSLVRRSNGRRS